MFNDPASMQRVVDFLNVHNIPYMLIGGLAISTWGEMRVTHDADFKVAIDMPVADFSKLDLKYIRRWLTQFTEALETPEILARFEYLYKNT